MTQKKFKAVMRIPINGDMKQALREVQKRILPNTKVNGRNCTINFNGSIFVITAETWYAPEGKYKLLGEQCILAEGTDLVVIYNNVMDQFARKHAKEMQKYDSTKVASEKEQYNKNSFLNSYSQDIHTKYISNITGQYENTKFCMFKSQCYLNDITYSCERVCKNGINGLYFKRDDWETYCENGFDIEAEDPRMVIMNEEVYIIFICLSPYKNQNRCIGLTKFNIWER